MLIFFLLDVSIAGDDNHDLPELFTRTSEDSKKANECMSKYLTDMLDQIIALLTKGKLVSGERLDLQKQTLNEILGVIESLNKLNSLENLKSLIASERSMRNQYLRKTYYKLHNLISSLSGPQDLSSQVQNNLLNIETQIASLRQQAQQSQELIKSMTLRQQTQASTQDDAVVLLQRQVADAQEEKMSAVAKLQSFLNKIISVSTLLEQLLDLAKNNQGLVSANQQRLQPVLSDLKSTRQQNQILQNKCNLLTQQAQAFQTEVYALNSHVAELEKELEQSKEGGKLFHHVYKKIQKFYEKLAALDSSSDILDLISNIKQTQQHRFNTLEHQLYVMRNDAGLLNQKFSEQASQASQAEDNLKKELDDMKQKLEQAESDLSQAKSDKGAMTEEQATQITSLKEAVAELTLQSQQVQAQAASQVQQAQAASQAQQAQVQSQVGQLQTEKSLLAQQLAEQQETAQKAQAGLSQAQTNLQQAVSTRDQLSSQLASAQQTLQMLQSQYGQQVVAMQNSLEGLSSQKDSLTAQLSQAANAITSLQQSGSYFQQAASNYYQQLQAAAQQISQMQQAFVQLQAQLQQQGMASSQLQAYSQQLLSMNNSMGQAVQAIGQQQQQSSVQLAILQDNSVKQQIATAINAAQTQNQATTIATQTSELDAEKSNLTKERDVRASADASIDSTVKSISLRDSPIQTPSAGGQGSVVVSVNAGNTTSTVSGRDAGNANTVASDVDDSDRRLSPLEDLVNELEKSINKNRATLEQIRNLDVVKQRTSSQANNNIISS